MPGRVLWSGERNVRGPSGIGPHVQEQRHVHEHDADQVRVVAERVESREGDAARAHHERHEVEAHRRHDRHGEEEHHRRAVHGEDLVVPVGAEEGILGARELEPHHPRLETAGDEHEEGGDEVPLGDRFVIDGREPAPESTAVAPGDVKEARLLEDVLLGERLRPGAGKRDRGGGGGETLVRWKAARRIRHLSVCR